jgi:eukaryotic-like serine/threonine-protein kinase
MNGFTPVGVWRAIRRAKLLRILAVYLTTAFVVLQAVDIFVDRLALPDWFFPGAIVLLLVGLPIIVATALVQSAPVSQVDPDAAGVAKAEAGSGTRPESSGDPASVAAAESSREADPHNASAAGVPPQGSRRRGAARAPVALADVIGVAREWLTWHRTLAGGVLAFVLLIFTVTGYSAMRALGIGPVGSLVAAGVIDARDRILIADFQSQTGDTLLAGVVTEAFRVDFAQSPVVTVVEPAFVRDVLRRMERDPAMRLDDVLAREVALRDGIKAVVTGEIAAAGSGYVISARLVATESQQVLAAFRETAPGEAAIIPAIDRLSNRLRERIGESLRTIRGNAPLEQVTTASLDALRKYTQALHASQVVGDHVSAIALFEDAIALDPQFAMAHRGLAILLGNRGLQPARRTEASTRAYQLRDRLTERERHLTISSYHTVVTGDRDQAIAALRGLLAGNPDDPSALNNLGVLYWQQRDWARADEHYRQAWALDNTSGIALSNRVPALYNLGRAEEARAVLEDFAGRFPDLATYYEYSAGMAGADGEYERAAQILGGIAEVRPDDINHQASVANGRAILAQVQGKLAEAARHQQDAVAASERRGTGAQGRLDAAIDDAFRDLTFRHARDRALARVDAALSRDPLDTLDPRERPYESLGWFFAEAELPDRLRALITDFDAARGGEVHRSARIQRRGLDAALARAERRFADLLTILPETDDGPCSVCVLPQIARAQLELGRTDAAIDTYESYVSTIYIWRFWIDSWFLAEAYETLADLHDARGNAEKARIYYANLVDLWRDADPELQPRVRAAEQRLQRLIREPEAQ